MQKYNSSTEKSLAICERENFSIIFSFNQALDQTIEMATLAIQNDQVVGVPTGLPTLDEKLGGLINRLIILAGRPSMGKTALATNIAYYATKYSQRQEKSSVAFSLKCPLNSFQQNLSGNKNKI